MTRRIKRLPEFELSLQMKKENFLRPPRDVQKNWLLNRIMNEFTQDLYALDELAARFVPGVELLDTADRTHAELADKEIMEDWQIPVMEAMTEAAIEAGDSVLEIGFGRGVASTMIQACDVGEHTIIECNDSIVSRFDHWKEKYPGRKIEIVHGLWQDVLPALDKFDAVFFHTYPLKASDYLEQIAESTTFAEHFFPHAAEHLVHGGVFTYLSNEMDSLSRTHQRLLFRHFRSIALSIAAPLNLPQQVQDQWWADSMVIVTATR